MSAENSNIHSSEQDDDVQRVKVSLRELVNSFSVQDRNKNLHLDLILQNLESTIKATPPIPDKNLSCTSEAKKPPQLPSNNEIKTIHGAEFPNTCEEDYHDILPSSPDQLFDSPCTGTGTGIMSVAKRKLTSDINSSSSSFGAETGESFAKKQREETTCPEVESPVKLESDLESEYEDEEYFCEKLPIAEVEADHQMFTIELVHEI